MLYRGAKRRGQAKFVAGSYQWRPAVRRLDLCWNDRLHGQYRQHALDVLLGRWSVGTDSMATRRHASQKLFLEQVQCTRGKQIFITSE